MFLTDVVEKIKADIWCPKTFSENRAVCEAMWKIYCRVSQVTDDSMAYANCILNT